MLKLTPGVFHRAKEINSQALAGVFFLHGAETLLNNHSSHKNIRKDLKSHFKWLLSGCKMSVKRSDNGSK